MQTIASVPSRQSIAPQLAEITPIRVVRDEGDTPYDGQTKAERQGDGRFAMIPVCVLSLGDGEAIGLYAILTGYANARGECWPSIATLTKATGWGRNKVYRAIKALVVAGVVELVKRDNRGMNQANLYRLTGQKTLQRQSSQGGTAQSHSETLAVPIRDTGSPTLGRELDPVELQPEEQHAPLPPTSQNGHAPAAAASSDDYIRLLGKDNLDRLTGWLLELDRTFGGVGWVKSTLRDLQHDVPGLGPAQIKAGLEIGYERFEHRYQADRGSIVSVTGLARRFFRDALEEQQA